MAIVLPSLVVAGTAPDYAQHLAADVNDALNRISLDASTSDDIDAALADAAGQLPATATNDDAAAGRLGEFYAAGSGSGVSATVTISNASPAVVTMTGHGVDTGTAVFFTTTGTLPTGLSPSTNYYIHKIDADTFHVATTLANLYAETYVDTSSAGSGTHTGRQHAVLATATSIDIFGIELTAGDWDVSGSYEYVGDAASGVNVTRMFATLATSSGTIGVLKNNTLGAIMAPAAGVVNPSAAFQQVGPARMSLSATTVIYLTARANFTVAALYARGALSARRMR